MSGERSERFRAARPHEVDDVAGVVAHSFPAPDRGTRWWRDRLVHGPHGGVDSLWLAEGEGGEIVGCCLLLPLRQWIAGRAFPMMGLGLVTTAPTYRRRGLAGRMIGAGLAAARERGDLVSALYPFRTGYYRSLGYGLAGEAHQYMVPATAFPDSRDERLRMRAVRDADGREMLASIYDRGIRLQTGQVERSDHAWRYVLEGDDRAAFYYLDEDDRPQGYVIVRYRTDLPLRERYLDVEERMWLTPAARRGIYAWLASMGDQWARVAYRAHPNERFDAVLEEPRLPWGEYQGWQLWYPAATLLRGPMFRLLNVPDAFAARAYADPGAFDVVLEVEDPQLPANAGPWRMRFEAGRAEVTRVESEPDLRIPVHALSSAFIGETRVGDAVRDGIAISRNPETIRKLDSALEVPRPWTFERF